MQDRLSRQELDVQDRRPGTFFGSVRLRLFAVAETKSVVEKSSRHVWECQVKSGIRTRNSSLRASLRSPATSLDDERSEQKFCLKKVLLKKLLKNRVCIFGIRNPNIMTRLLSTSGCSCPPFCQLKKKFLVSLDFRFQS